MSEKQIRRLLTLPAVGLLASFAWTTPAQLPEPHPDLPPEFQQLLPRGRIASIDQPVFVDAAAAEIDKDAWIVGVELDGEARAYSINLLNSHEVVNDKIGENAFAVVW